MKDLLPASRRRFDPHVLIFWTLAGLLILPAIRGVRTALDEHGNDLTIFLEAACAVTRGESPYTDPGYLYLPVFSVILAPLTLLPLWLAVALWQLSSWAAVLYSVRIVTRLVDPNRFQPWLGWASLAFVYRLADSCLAYGQANALTLVLMMKSIDLARRHRWMVAAFLVGFAAAVKILPVALLAVFLLASQWRPALLGGAVFASLTTLLPWAAMRTELAIRVHVAWFDQILRPYLEGGDALLARGRVVPGQSLVAYGYHLLADLPVSTNDPGMRANLLDLPPAAVHRVVRAVTLGHLAVAAVLGVWWTRAYTARRFLEVSSLFMCTVLLCAPIVHRAHFLWTLPAVTLLLSWAGDSRSSWPRTLARVALALSGALIGLTSSGIVGSSASRWLTGHGVVTLGGEVIWLTLVVILYARYRR